MLSFNPYTILFTIINLLVLWVLLRLTLFKKITAILDNRAQSVQDQRTRAADERAQAEQEHRQYDQLLEQAHQESAELLAQTRAQAQREYQAMLDSAHADAQRLMDSTRSQLAAERETMLQGARKEVAQLALLAAARVTQQKLGAQDDMALVDSFLTEMGEPS